MWLDVMLVTSMHNIRKLTSPSPDTFASTNGYVPTLSTIAHYHHALLALDTLKNQATCLESLNAVGKPLIASCRELCAVGLHQHRLESGQECIYELLVRQPGLLLRKTSVHNTWSTHIKELLQLGSTAREQKNNTMSSQCQCRQSKYAALLITCHKALQHVHTHVLPNGSGCIVQHLLLYLELLNELGAPTLRRTLNSTL